MSYLNKEILHEALNDIKNEPIEQVQKGLCVYFYYRHCPKAEEELKTLLSVICNNPTSQFYLNRHGFLKDTHGNGIRVVRVNFLNELLKQWNVYKLYITPVRIERKHHPTKI